MASLTKRIVVRISDDLDQWISEQAENEGLDSATWVRATLMRMRHPLITRPQPELVTLTEYSKTLSESDYREASAQPDEPIDVDAIVSEGLEQAIALGQAEADVAQEQVNSSAVRPLARRPPPYSLASQPGWIK